MYFKTGRAAVLMTETGEVGVQALLEEGGEDFVFSTANPLSASRVVQTEAASMEEPQAAAAAAAAAAADVPAQSPMHTAAGTAPRARSWILRSTFLANLCCAATA